MTDTRKRVLLVLATIGLAILVGEVAVRTSDLIRGRGFFSGVRNRISNPRPLVPFRTFGIVPYRDVDGERVIASRHGELYPLRKPPATTRIVVFGGSTTENKQLMDLHGSHYPGILQTVLRERLGRDDIEVINVANTAYATPHSLILLELDVLSWDPDVVILSHNINDLSAAYFPGGTFHYANKYGHEYFGLPNLRSLFSLRNMLFQHSQLYWILDDRVSKTAMRVDPRYEIRRTSYGMDPPAGAREAFRRNLRSFVALARANEVTVVLGTQPLEPSEEFFERHMGFKPYNDVVRYPLHEEFVAHHRAYNQTIRDVAAEEGTLLVDNEAIFGGRTELFTDFVHNTLPGARLLAESFADGLISDGVVP